MKLRTKLVTFLFAFVSSEVLSDDFYPENHPCKDLDVAYQTCEYENEDTCFSFADDCTAAFEEFLGKWIVSATSYCSAALLDEYLNQVRTCCKPCATQTEEFLSCFRPRCDEYYHWAFNGGNNNENPVSLAVTGSAHLVALVMTTLAVVM